MSDINALNDFDRGELDCILGYPSLENETEQYYDGYSAEYVRQQIQSAGGFN
jgi:hypothetical protein